MMPSVVVEGDLEAAEKWYKLHVASERCKDVTLDSIDTHPVIVEVEMRFGNRPLLMLFRKRVELVNREFTQICRSKSRTNSKWVVFVDAGEKGADIVASKGGVPTYVGSSQLD